MTSGETTTESIESESALLDTNVLVYGYFMESPQHEASRALLDKAQDADANLCIAPQNLVEFFSIVTSPRRVTKAKTPAEAVTLVDELLALPGLMLLTVPADVVARWLQILRQCSAKGRAVFDLQLAATMLGNGVGKLYTYNLADFQGISGIQAVIPPSP
jgi:toxin-antitoxin system PIN domain toxin